MIQDNYFILNGNNMVLTTTKKFLKSFFFLNVFFFLSTLCTWIILKDFKHNTNNFQGDLIISVTQLIEALTIVTDYSKKPDIIEIVDTRT